MKENMPGSTAPPVFSENGRFMSNGYVDRGPRREWLNDRSAHRGSNRWTPGKDYNPEGRDTRYERPEPGSIMGRAKHHGDSETLYAITEGRMLEEDA